MYRRVVLSSTRTLNGNPMVLYHVHGAAVLSEYRRIGAFDNGEVGVKNVYNSVVSDSSIKLQSSGGIMADRSYEYILEVSDNQPVLESIEELTSTGVVIKVYNEYGVLVCDNSASLSGNSNQPQTDGSGEMTSEPIDGTGEMTSVPGEKPSEMTSEPIDGTVDKI